MKKPTVKLQPHMLHSVHAFVAEVRREMRLCGFYPEQIGAFEWAALEREGSPIQEALKYVELEVHD